MTAAPLIILLALGWVAVTGGFSLANFALGAIVAGFVIFLLRHWLVRPMAISRVWRITALALLFLKELLLSAMSVAALVVAPDLKRRLKPAIIAFPLTATSDAEITLLANLITLTPGTLSLDVSPDRRLLYVHALSLRSRERLVSDIANGLEKRVVEVFR